MRPTACLLLLSTLLPTTAVEVCYTTTKSCENKQVVFYYQNMLDEYTDPSGNVLPPGAKPIPNKNLRCARISPVEADGKADKGNFLQAKQCGEQQEKTKWGSWKPTGVPCAGYLLGDPGCDVTVPPKP